MKLLIALLVASIYFGEADLSSKKADGIGHVVSPPLRSVSSELIAARIREVVLQSKDG